MAQCNRKVGRKSSRRNVMGTTLTESYCQPNKRVRLQLRRVYSVLPCELFATLHPALCSTVSLFLLFSFLTTRALPLLRNLGREHHSDSHLQHIMKAKITVMENREYSRALRRLDPSQALLSIKTLYYSSLCSCHISVILLHYSFWEPSS